MVNEIEENKTLDAFPAKRFFVDMLTKDIELLDAVLDLIDNSLDGAMREAKRLNVKSDENKYEGYKVEIQFDNNEFSIKDNCGGIPRDVAINSAFRMGRPSTDIDVDLPTVGVYGIGMKRSIFKMGKSCKVVSKNDSTVLTVDMSPEWIADDNNWSLPYQEHQVDDAQEKGTEIIIRDLREGVKKLFSVGDAFFNDLKSSAETYYSSFIERGFKIIINDVFIEANINMLAIENDFSNKKEAISPYVYMDEIDDVKVSVIIGFYRSFITQDEEDDALNGSENKASSSKAGVTIVCNDRVVLPADKSRMTGWGESGVPNYHTQFISIAGIVRFQCNDPSKLPLTTTKRGIEGNSDLYLKVKDRIKEGLKIFTGFTNKWKNRDDRAKLSIQAGSTKNFTPSDVLNSIPTDKWVNMRGEENKNAKKFVPNLPSPPRDSTNRRISFSRPIEDIKIISDFYFEYESASPKEVGEKCFDEALRRAK